MYFSYRHAGWIFPADDRAIPRVLREKLQAPYVWPFCPFCSETLPDLVSGFAKGIDEEFPPPWKESPPTDAEGPE